MAAVHRYSPACAILLAWIASSFPYRSRRQRTHSPVSRRRQLRCRRRASRRPAFRWGLVYERDNRTAFGLIRCTTGIKRGLSPGDSPDRSASLEVLLPTARSGRVALNRRLPAPARSRFDVLLVHAVFRRRKSTGAVRRVMTEKCSPASWQFLVIRGADDRRPGCRGVVSPVSDSDLAVSGLTCHARLHQSIRCPLPGHAPRHSPFLAAFRYPQRTARSGWTLSSPVHPTALMGFKPFAGLLPLRRRPRCFHRALSRMPFTRVFSLGHFRRVNRCRSFLKGLISSRSREIASASFRA